MMFRPIRVALTSASSLAGLVLAAAAVAGDEPPARPNVVQDQEIESLLAPILKERKVPGLVAGIVQGDGLKAVAAVGVRKAGSPEPITVNDKLHLGSCTKAMTATRLALLVEQEKLSWKSTVGEVFADVKADLHPDFHAVTLEQLLTHRGGLPANAFWQAFRDGTLVDQREAVLRKILAQPPAHPPGTKFLYSNVGYVVAGHMAERITGRPWEELMKDGLFEPLGMTSAGFGPPGEKDKLDQPWGHQWLMGKANPNHVDNAAVIGPAGTVHCSLADWGRFIGLHLQGARGNKTLLMPETVKFLHAPPEPGEKYACGWGVVERPWANGEALTHSGSNTMWFATVWIAAKRDFAVMAVTNQGGDAAPRACDDAVTALIASMPR